MRAAGARGDADDEAARGLSICHPVFNCDLLWPFFVFILVAAEDAAAGRLERWKCR